MARDFIFVDKTQSAAVKAALLLQYRDSMRRTLELGTEILAVMGHLNDAVVFTDIEARFGLPAGKGQTVFNLVNGADGSMRGTFQVPDAKNLTEILGG